MKVHGLPPVMAIDFASSYLLNKARLNLADQQLEKMQNQAKPSELEQRLADFLTKAEESSLGFPSFETYGQRPRADLIITKEILSPFSSKQSSLVALFLNPLDLLIHFMFVINIEYVFTEIYHSLISKPNCILV